MRFARLATSADLPALEALHRASITTLCRASYSDAQLAAWLATLSRERYARVLASPAARMFVVEDSGSLLGFGTVTPSAGMLNAVYVAPSQIGQGTGRVLVAALEDAARADGCATLALNSTPHAVGFYTRLGYAASGPSEHRLASGVVLAAVAMARQL